MKKDNIQDCEIFEDESKGSDEYVPHERIKSACLRNNEKSVLFPIKTNWARLKHHTSDLDHFVRFFPNKKLNFYFGTWNMQDQKILPTRLIEFILPLEIECLADIYVISTQESTSMIHKWIVAIQKILGIYYYMLTHSQFGSLSTLIFVRRDILWYCSVQSIQQISTRAGSKIKTKGAVAIKMFVFGNQFILVNSHFTSGDEEMESRINDYNKIYSHLQEGFGINADEDTIFWLGDLNFRLNSSCADIQLIMSSELVNKDKIREILLFDTLSAAMKSNKVFGRFEEPTINFFPTYKVDAYTNEYLYRQRSPAYTDRILYHSGKNMKIAYLHYNSTVLYTSDHRAVYGYFEIQVGDNKEIGDTEESKKSISTSPGGYARKVYKKAVKSNNKMQNFPNKSKTTSYCSIQ